MRFYPNADVSCYVEYSDGWDRYCRWPRKKWGKHDLSPTTTINYWRDLEGAKKPEIKLNDLYFEKWMTSRIRPEACLPVFYCVGNRFIRITRAPPAGFKCATVPLNLAEARVVRRRIREEEKLKKKLAKEAKKAKKLAKLESKKRKVTYPAPK